MLSEYKQKLKEEYFIYILCKIFPSAIKSEIKNLIKNNVNGRDLEYIQISLVSGPIKNKANTELINLLSKEFLVEKKNIFIISGKTDRMKLIKIKI